jgi:SPW repeat
MATRNRIRTRDELHARDAYDLDRPAPDEALLGAEEPPPAPLAAPDWRSEVAGASGLNVLAGIWLIISPFVLGYSGADATWNPIVFGAIVGVFALIRTAGAYREAWLSSLNMAIGVWLFISAFWLASTTRASWNVAISGIVVFVLGAWSASATSDGLMRSRGARRTL